jgi:hypothetical protein
MNRIRVSVSLSFCIRAWSKARRRRTEAWLAAGSFSASFHAWRRERAASTTARWAKWIRASQ